MWLRLAPTQNSGSPVRERSPHCFSRLVDVVGNIMNGEQWLGNVWCQKGSPTGGGDMGLSHAHWCPPIHR